MYKFMFIVVILLLFLSSFFSTATAAAASDVDKHFCNESEPIFSEVTEEIHAMLARDRYIDFIGWNQSTKDYRRGRPQKIPYGYIKEMILHLSSVPGEDGSMNARVFFTSNGTKLFDVEFKNCTREDNVQFSPYCPLREQFIKFKFFKYGVKIAYVYIAKNGTQYPVKGVYPDNSISTECLEYTEPKPNADDEPVNRILFSGSHRTEYSNIDGLLIQINCNTTDVKKILVKCAPFPNESTNSG